MTVSSATNRAQYDGDGTSTQFPVPFYFLEPGHLKLVRIAAGGAETVLSPGLDYTVAGAGDPAGGSVILGTAPAAGEAVVILRDIDAVQETDFEENADLPAETLERSLDRLTMLVQQLSELSARAMLLPTATALTDVAFPAPEAGKLIAGNAQADGFENVSPQGAGQIVFPIGVADGGTGSTSGAAALLALGLVSPNFHIFTASGDFEKANLPGHVTHVNVWGLAGGGGGGGANTSTNYRGVGGGAGGFFMKRIAVSALAASETVTVGPGGAGGTSSASPTVGANGGVTSFGAHASATGGLGGAAASGTGLSGSAGGAGSNGDLNLIGSTSGTMSNSGGAGSAEVAPGGDAPLGLGQGGRNISEAGKGFGAGGAPGNHSGTDGGVGAPGLVIVWW